jgi:hypothetical protein
MPKKKKKSRAARNAPVNRTGRGSAGRQTSVLAKKLLNVLIEDSAHREHAETFRLNVAEAGGTFRPVIFKCTNAGCLVGVTAGTLNIVFSGTGGASMPVGSYPIFWRVQGSGAFMLTVEEGGTLSSPVESTAPDAGTRTLTVPA